MRKELICPHCNKLVEFGEGVNPDLLNEGDLVRRGGKVYRVRGRNDLGVVEAERTAVAWVMPSEGEDWEFIRGGSGG